MKALVTGGGGFLGLLIVKRLRERGIEVRSFSRSSYPVLESLNVEQINGDLGDDMAVSAAVAGCDVVFHVAAKAGVWGPYRDYHTANVVGTRNVVSACQKHNVNRLIFTSSPSVTFAGTDQEGIDESAPYPRKFLAAYPQTKAMAEQFVLKSNGPDLATVALRPHLIWGPGDPHLIPRLVERARKGKLRRIGSRPNLVDTTYVDNAADAHLAAFDRLAPGSLIAGKAYFISNDEPLPVWDFINRILARMNIPPVTRSIPTSVAYSAGAMLEYVYRYLPFLGEPPMTRFVARQLSTSHWFDLTAAKQELGYRPTVTIEEGLRRL